MTVSVDSMRESNATSPRMIDISRSLVVYLASFTGATGDSITARMKSLEPAFQMKKGYLDAISKAFNLGWKVVLVK